MQTGYLQVYTGDGKGKTTAALGLAVRAVGAGLKVFIGQFIKGMHYSELDALKSYDAMIDVEQWGRGCFIKREPGPEDVASAEKGLDKAAEILQGGEYDVVILDEAVTAVKLNLISEDDLIATLLSRQPDVEVVITGRGASELIIENADLVTECRAVKHYFAQGVTARRGIEK